MDETGGTTLEVYPLSPERWEDLETLFGERGACGGCWCMYWRRPHADFEADKGAGNREAMRALVLGGAAPGLIAYAGPEPVGWISLGPREDFPRLAASRILKPLDERPVWSVVCFFLAKPWRGSGVAGRLLAAAVEFARGRGATLLEGYPVEPRQGRLPAPFVWTGLPPIFRRAGFHEAARRSPTRPIFRLELPPAEET